MKCPNCGSENVEVNGLYYKCRDCRQLDDSTFSMIMEACNHEEKVGGEKCPKCGSEMLYQTETLKRLLRWVCSNQDCRYEEKVGGEGK